MTAGGAIDQLARDPDTLAGLANAAFEDELYPQLGGNLLQFDRPALVGKAGIAAYHEQAADLGQVGDDVLGDAVREEFLAGIVAHVVERQYGDRRFFPADVRGIAFDRWIGSGNYYVIDANGETKVL